MTVRRSILGVETKRPQVRHLSDIRDCLWLESGAAKNNSLNLLCYLTSEGRMDFSWRVRGEGVARRFGIAEEVGLCSAMPN